MSIGGVFGYDVPVRVPACVLLILVCGCAAARQPEAPGPATARDEAADSRCRDAGATDCPPQPSRAEQMRERMKRDQRERELNERREAFIRRQSH